MFSLSDDSIVEIFDEEIDFETLVTIPADPERSGWTVGAYCRLNAISLTTSRLVQYDAGEHDFVVPSSGWDLVSKSMENFNAELDTEGRLWVACKSMPPGIVIQFVAATVRDVYISPAQLWLPLPVEETLDGLCGTRIVFRHGIETLIIGRLLTRRMGRVILNNPDTTLHLPLKRVWPDSTSFQSAPVFVPLFYPYLSDTFNNLIIFTAVENQEEFPGGLVLASSSTDVVEFLRTRPESDGLQEQTFSCGDAMEAEISRERIVVFTQPGKTHQVRFQVFPMTATLHVRTKHIRHIRFTNDKSPIEEQP